MTLENLTALAEHWRKTVVVTKMEFNAAAWDAVREVIRIDNTTVGSRYEGIRIVINSAVPDRKVKCFWSDGTESLLPL